MTAPAPTITTAEGVRTAETDDLVRALRAAAGPDDNARRGAIHALTGYNDGTLINHAAVRSYIVADPTDGPLVQWSRLRRHLEDVRSPEFDVLHLAESDPRRGLTRLGTTGLDALQLAVSLGDGQFTTNLRSLAGRTGRVNRVTLLEAIAIAFGILGPITLDLPARDDPGA